MLINKSVGSHHINGVCLYATSGVVSQTIWVLLHVTFHFKA